MLLHDLSPHPTNKYRSTIKIIHTDQHPLWNDRNHEFERLRHEIGCTVRYSSAAEGG